MTSDEQELKNFEDEPDCGVDAASDQGFWLEEADEETTDCLISWRKKTGLSPEKLSELAPIPLEEYLAIEKGERTMTNGDAWRIDAAIIAYRLATESRFHRCWRKGGIQLVRFRCRLRNILNSETWGVIIAAVIVATFYHGFLREYIEQPDDIVSFFVRSAFTLGIPVCMLISGLVWIAMEWRKMD